MQKVSEIEPKLFTNGKAMKKIIILLLIIQGFVWAVNAQTAAAVSEEKKRIISEIVKVTNAEQKAKEVMNSMFEQMRLSSPVIMEGVLSSKPELSETGKDYVRKSMLDRDKFQQNFERKFISKINFREYVQQIIYPLYDKFFTEEELKDLLAFYKSPTGQKFNQISPNFMAESIKLAQQYLTPKIGEIFQELVDDEVKNTNPPVPRKPQK